MCNPHALCLGFVSTCSYLPQRRETGLQVNPRRVGLPQRFKARPIRVAYVAQMRNNRNARRSFRERPRGSSSKRGSSSPDFQIWARRAETLWAEAGTSERAAYGLAALGVVAIAGGAINILFHVSLAVAFMIIPLIFAPILLTIMASVSLFVFLTFATAGAGAFVLGTPILAFAFLTKLLFPFAILAGGAAFVARRLLGWDSASNEVEDDEGVFDAEEYAADELNEFDRKLRYRDGLGQRSSDITCWDLGDVVEELDFTGLGEYRQLFIEERIDGRTLLNLTDEDIKVEFGRNMPLGDRMRLSQLVADLRRRSSRLP